MKSTPSGLQCNYKNIKNCELFLLIKDYWLNESNASFHVIISEYNGIIGKVDLICRSKKE